LKTADAIPFFDLNDKDSLLLPHNLLKSDWIKDCKDKVMSNSKEALLPDEHEVNPYQDIEKTDESSDPEIKKPFDPTKIDMTVKPLIIDSLIIRMKSEPPRIDFNTGFQPGGNLWDETTQSRLIESLLVRIPIPVFYFDGTDDNCWKVVDGLQRLITLKRFIIDKTLKLQNLEFLEKYNGFGFDDLPAYLRARIEEAQITVYIINPGTPDYVKYAIFKRIKTGVSSWKPQEIRFALNPGIPTHFVKELAELPEFKRATHYLLIHHKRMEDSDFVMRFIAFYDGYKEYQPDLDNHLNTAMARLNGLSVEEREQIKKDFIKAMDAVYRLFGEYAFRKRYKTNDRKYPINKALFETWAVNLSRLSEKDIEVLISRKDVVINKFIELMKNNNDFLSSITTGTGKYNAVKTRFSRIETLLKGILQ
jgi:hypothetical protein